MKLTVFRKKKQRGRTYDYQLGCLLKLTEAESQLVDKYRGWKKTLQVWEALVGRPNIRGPQSVSIKALVDGGQWWISDRLHPTLTDIPLVLEKSLYYFFHDYTAREKWGTIEKEISEIKDY